jgi:hypothetical protein
VLFKVAGFADAQRRREAIAAGGALFRLCMLTLHICGPGPSRVCNGALHDASRLVSPKLLCALRGRRM